MVMAVLTLGLLGAGFLIPDPSAINSPNGPSGHGQANERLACVVCSWQLEQLRARTFSRRVPDNIRYEHHMLDTSDPRQP